MDITSDNGTFDPSRHAPLEPAPSEFPELAICAEPADDVDSDGVVNLRVLNEGVFVGTLTLTLAAYQSMGSPSELYVKVGNNVV